MKSSLKTLAAQAFSRLRAAHRFRTKSVLKQQGDIFDGFLFFVVAGMNIAVHRGLEIRLSQDALDGLHVRASVVQHCSYRVPEDVRRGSMEVHRSVDALHHTSEGSERQRLLRVIAADDKTLFAQGQEVGKQVWNQAATLHREVIIANRVKTMNNSVHYNVDAIHNAIAENKQISFQYFHHDIGKKKVYSNKGEKVFVSPWALIYTDDNYYLLAFHTQRQEFRHYRVDRMDKVEKAMYDREGQEAFAKVDMAEYTKYTFSMYRGDKQPVTMRFTIDMVDAVMDRFGRDVLMLKADDRHFEVTAVVSVSPQFFGWVFGLGNKVEIIRPDDVREQMKDVLKQTLSKYDDNKWRRLSRFSNCTNSAKKDCCCRFAQWQREQDAKHPFVLLTEGL